MARVGRNASANYAFVPSNTGTRDWYTYVRTGAREFTEPEILGLLPQERRAESSIFDPVLMCNYTGETEGPYVDNEIYTFLNVYTVQEEANYIYRRFNTSTNSFGDAYDSTVSKTTYGINNINEDGKSVVVTYYNNDTNDLLIHIISLDGSVVQELTYSSSSYINAISRNIYAHLYIDVSDNLQGVLYDQNNDTFDTFQVDNVSNIENVYVLQEHTICFAVEHPADSGLKTIYRYSYGNDNATELFKQIHTRLLKQIMENI